MFLEIKKANWLQFCKQFNLDNQYRRVKVNIMQESIGITEIAESSMFLGLSISKKGRRIDEMRLIVGGKNQDVIAEPVAVVYQPFTLSVMKDDTGADIQLEIVGFDGKKISFQLEGEQTPQFRYSLMEEFAYSAFERRGGDHGRSLEDWLEAEEQIANVEHELA